jgi:hypothetical protein
MSSLKREARVFRRVGNFRQKNNSAEDGIDGTNGYFRRNSGCSAEQKFSEFRSEPCRGRENTRNSVSWNKSRRKLSEFPSEPFNGRENSSEFRSVEHKKRQPLGIPFRTLQRKSKQLGIPFRGTKIEAISRNSLPNHSAEEKITQNKTRQQYSN